MMALWQQAQKKMFQSSVAPELVIQQLPEISAQQQKVGELLQQAEQYLSHKNRVSPPRENAFYVYQEVLRIEPKNSVALNGVDGISNHYATLAQDHLSNNQLELAKQDVKTLETINPNSVITRSMQAQLDQAMRLNNQAATDAITNAITSAVTESVIQDDEIDRLLILAENDMASGKFLKPEYDNALLKYQRVLNIDAENEQALKGIRHLISYYERRAKSNLQQSRWQAAERALDNLEWVDPEFPRLKRLRSELEKKRGNEQNIHLLLSKAEQRYQRKRYLKPRGDNAFDLYQQVLRVDSTNRQALDGVDNIQRYYEKRFYRQLKKGHFKSAQSSVNRIAKISPNSILWHRVRDELLEAKSAKKIADKVVEKSIKKNPEITAVPQKPDLEMISDLLSEFKNAFESKNRPNLEAISDISASRRGFIKQFFEQYHSLRLRVSNFQHINKKHQGTASIQITDLISRSGESVQPGSWARFDIIIKKNQVGDWKVFW